LVPGRKLRTLTNNLAQKSITKLLVVHLAPPNPKLSNEPNPSQSIHNINDKQTNTHTRAPGQQLPVHTHTILFFLPVSRNKNQQPKQRDEKKKKKQHLKAFGNNVVVVRDMAAAIATAVDARACMVR
jgi:hypothetical protein